MKIKINTIVFIGVCVLFATIIISWNYDYSSNDFEKAKTADAFIGEYEYIEKDEKFSTKSNIKLSLKKNGECSYYRYYKTSVMTNVYESDYCNFTYEPLSNTIYLEYDNVKNYNKRMWEELTIVDDGIKYSQNIILKRN